MIPKDDFESQEINNKINNALFKIMQEYNITFTEAKFRWDYNENLYNLYE